jgi:hypothetical protein
MDYSTCISKLIVNHYKGWMKLSKGVKWNMRVKVIAAFVYGDEGSGDDVPALHDFFGT